MNYASKCSSNENRICMKTMFGFLADCSGLGLTAVPWFTESVISVNLSKNSLQNVPQDDRLPSKLKYLDLSENIILNFGTDGPLPFSNTKHLLSLNLSHNRISLDKETYFKGIFTNLGELQHLDVSHKSFGNRSYYCPDEVFQELESLQSLSIDGLTELTSRITIPNDYFVHFPNLKFLDLSSHWDRHVSLFAGLDHIESGTFRRLARLEVLNISYKRKLGLCGFKNVTHDLPFTPIKVFKAQYLACERSGSTWLFNNDIKPLLNTKLEELYIDGNNLDKTENTATTLIPRSLRYLSATDNRWIVAQYSYYKILPNLTNVKTIDLSFQNRHQMSQSVNSSQCDHPDSVIEIACLCERFPYNVNTNHLTFQSETSYNSKAVRNKENNLDTIHSC
ncbi:unnamed protein product [Mytilus coruscus]|uniref:Uncharacterized protein n=1 Tax=Mytilus coruscus TaxID=42192 RepID=A0A6J8A0Y9_MYTCO|nr:unnamed protein product [Mytilus coruscus]